MNRITLIVIINLFFLSGCSSQQPDDHDLSLVTSDEQYLILISFDGFRHDYPELHGAENLLKYASEGVKAIMIPSYPSKTFPNHYTIVTGLYPDHHGIVSNTFYDHERNQMYRTGDRTIVEDGSWYGGTPIWVLAEQHGLNTASFFWVGTEADIQGTHPRYYKKFDASIPNQERVDQVVEWLFLPKPERPRFITLYFELTDNQGHRFGPNSAETRQAVQELDGLLENLVSRVKETQLPVNFMVVSDHGMSPLDVDNPIYLPESLNLSDFIIAPSDAILMFYHDDKVRVHKMYEDLIALKDDRFRVYQREEIPDYLHFGSTNRVGDLLLIPEPPYVFSRPGAKVSPGTHGFDPYNVSDMHTIFYGWGPAIKQGSTVPPFENVHLFPLMAEILGINYRQLEIDGDPEVLKKIRN